MPRRITFKVPTKDGQRTEQGYKVHLMVGEQRHTFVLQFVGKYPSLLTDYASGYKIANLAPKALARYVAAPYGEHGTYAAWRHLAQETVEHLYRAKGLRDLLELFRSVPTINT